MQTLAQFPILLLAIYFGAATAWGQSEPENPADTSAAQAAIQAMQQSAQPSTPNQQAFPALKAESCKIAVPYVERPSGLLGVWDRDMTKYTIYRDGAGSLQQVKADLLSDTWWARSSGADVARNVSTLCNLVEHVAAALTPEGKAVDLAKDVSKEFGMAVKQQSVRVYQAITTGRDAGQGITDVLNDGTDALVMLAAKDGLTRVGAGQFAAVIDILKDIEENANKTQQASEFKSTVQEQIRKLDSLINENANNAAAQRDKLEAVEAIKDAVVAACNSGQPTQVLPAFASGADAHQPVQNVSQPTAPPNTPWWLTTLSTIRLPVRGTTAQPTQPAPAPSTPSAVSNKCAGVPQGMCTTH